MMSSTSIIFAARDLGIALSVNEDDRIRYTPKSAMPDWLLSEIKASKQALLFDLLLADALRYLAEHYVEGADLSVLDAPAERANVAYAAGDFAAYRVAIRLYVEVGVKEFQRVRREKVA